MLSTIKTYASLVKFSHTVFAFPFALIGFFLGLNRSYQLFDWRLLLLVSLCMITARSAAMAFNRFIDAEFDKKNPRTAQREIPTGKIKPFSALMFVIVSSLSFIATTFFINPLVFYLSPVALVVILGYSLTKRFSFLCHLILGTGLALAPIGAYLAVAARFDWLPLLFSFSVLFWVAGFDILYSLQDEDFDRANNLFSIPAKFGRLNAIRIARLLHFISVLILAFAGLSTPFGYIYFIGLFIFALLLLYQNLIVKPNDISRVNLAFAQTNGIASIIFGITTIADILL